MTTPNLNLPEIVESQAGKAITHNEALAMLDVFVNGTLLSRTTATPPGSPTAGDAYFVPGGATGDWAAQIGKVAHWYNNQWYFYPTPVQWLCYFLDETENYRFNGTDWDLVQSGGVDAAEFGIGTTAKFITVTDYNDLDQLQTGFYATFHSDTSTVANKPAFKQASNVNALIKVFKEGDRFSVEVVETKRTDSRHFREKTSASTWGSWRDLWAEIAAAAGSGGGSELTAAEIKTLYESNPDTNAFTDAEEATIANLGASAFLESFKDYGLGGDSPIYSDWDSIPLNFGGFLSIAAGSANLPSGLPDSFYILYYAGRTNDSVLAVSNSTSGIHKLRRGSEGWIYDGEIYHSGNSTKPAQHGLGNTGIDSPLITNCNSVINSGFYAVSASASNRPSGLGATNSRMLVTGGGFGSRTTQFFLYDNQTAATQVWVRHTWNGTDFSPWQTMYHSGNLDPDAIDKSTGKAYADMTAGNVTLTSEQSNVPVIQLGGTPGTSRTLTVAALERMWVVTNDSDGGCTLTTGSGGTVFLEAGYQYVVFGDGVGVRAAITIAPNGLKMNGDLILPIYSTASLPDPSTRYMVTVGCTDGDSGAPCLAVSDGGSWKRVSLGATVSAT